MTSNQVEQFAKAYSKATGIRFVPRSKVSRLLKLLLKRVAWKYIGLLPDLTDAMRPCFVRFFGMELAVLSFCPGKNTLPLDAQLEQMVHEVFHGYRIRAWVRRGGKVAGWYKRYFDPLDSDFRAIEEGGACAAAAEVRYALTGKVPKPPTLDSYLVTPEALAKAHKTFAVNLAEVKKLGRGGSTFPCVTKALTIMRNLGILD